MDVAMKAKIRQNVNAALQVLLERAPLVQRNYVLDDVKCVILSGGHRELGFPSFPIHGVTGFCPAAHTLNGSIIDFFDFLRILSEFSSSMFLESSRALSGCVVRCIPLDAMPASRWGLVLGCAFAVLLLTAESEFSLPKSPPYYSCGR
jgi:hypothetical protein